MSMSTKRCPQCQTPNPVSGNFCIRCGEPISLPSSPATSAPAEGPAEGTPIPQLQELRLQLSVLRRYLESLERRLDALVRGEATVGSTAADAPRMAVESTPYASPTGDIQLEPGPPTATTPAGAGTPASGGLLDLFRSWDWEGIPGNWFARIGSLALMMGAGFFLALAFSNDWIGPRGQVVLGIVGGLALVGAGEYWQRRYPKWAQAVTGSGVGILYLSLYAAVGIHQLIDSIPTSGALVLVTLVSSALALRYQSLALAILATAGGLLTPVILESDLPDQQLLLAYILLLDVGIVAISSFRNWRWLTLLGMVGSYALFASWLHLEPGTQLLMEQVGLSLIFVLFVAASALFHIIWRKVPGPTDLLLMTGNGITYFSFNYAMLVQRYDGWLPLMALGLAILYAAVAYAALRRSGVPMNVLLFALALALISLTIAVPLQLADMWISIAWAAEGLILLWVGFTVKNIYVRGFGLAVFSVLAVRLFFFDTPADPGPFTPILNERFLIFTAAVTTMYGAAYLYTKGQGTLGEWERHFRLVFLAAANFFTLWVLSAEVIHYFNTRQFFAFDATNARNLSLTLLWALYAGLLLAAGMVTRFRPVRLAALGLLSMVVVKLFLIDTFQLEREYRVAAFITLGLALLVVGFVYQRYNRVIKDFFLG